MKLNNFCLIPILIFIISSSYYGLVQAAVPISKEVRGYNQTELDIIRFIQADYYKLIKKVMTYKKNSKLEKILLSPVFKNSLQFIVFILAINLYGDRLYNKSLSNILKGMFKKNKDDDFVFNPEFLNKSGLSYALLFYFGIGLIIFFIADFVSAPKHVNLQSLTNYGGYINELLLNCQDAYKKEGESGLKPELYNEILLLLERDYILIYNKIIAESAVGGKGFMSMMSDSFFIALYFDFIKGECFEMSFVISLFLLFMIHNFVLPSKDNFKNFEKLDEIYKAITQAKVTFLKTLVEAN